jgi:heme oxygenase
MAFQLSNSSVRLQTPSCTAGDLLRGGQLCQPLRERLNQGRDQAAFDYLARETSLDVINDCVRRIPDQQITDYLLEQVFLTASLLSSEAYGSVASLREDLRALGNELPKENPDVARVEYDRKVEGLGQYFFALGRRLHQLEQFMLGCPLSGSGEHLRGRYGQRVRDLAGGVRFMRQELARWVRRFVPLNRDFVKGSVDLEMLTGRIEAVVDELELRLREVDEVLRATVLEQLVIFDPSLTRNRLFRHDLENVLDLGHLLDSLSNLFGRVQEFDEQRHPEQLERVKVLLKEFRPAQFLSFAGVRESEQVLFLRSIERLERYRPGEGPDEKEDPIKVFLLLTGNLIASLRRQHRSA